ncbi:MAG: histidine--tRNA ligase [Janthinobacterium lividum]
MAGLQAPRGTHDLIGDEQRRYAHVVGEARRVAGLYGLDEWQTPIFEAEQVFLRTLGDTSDVVTKEMYSFDDRGGDRLTLRPEGTAGICRALVSNGLTQSLPQKVFYAGPMFRYERPQKGRFRQFHQVGAEWIGAAEPMADAEAIACGRDVLRALGVEQGVVLELNTLGDAESRAAYRAALVAYLEERRAELSAESALRLERNPMRVLDSKDDGDRRVVADAPVIGPHLTEPARAFFDAVRRGLDRFGVEFRENPRIVRGLDYYSHTAFEFVTERLGAQGTVLAGGRYDGLVAEMGGPATPAIGWAAGIERLSMLMEGVPAGPEVVAVVPVGEAAEAAAVDVLRALRGAGLRAEMAYRGTLKKRMERANRIGAAYAVILGEDELARGAAQLRDLRAGAQEEVALGDVAAVLARRVAPDAPAG